MFTPQRPLLPFLFLLLLLLLAASPSHKSFHVAASGGETDRLALLDVKAAITSDPRGSLLSWNASLPFCRWAGVTCDGEEDGRVTALRLDSMSLQGTISPSIGNLTFLTTLSLSNNSFHGAIPADVGLLSGLRDLNLSFNSLTGATIPPELAQLSSLRKLDLSENGLTGSIPPSLGELPSLAYLDLSENGLTGVLPPSLTNLSSLSVLDLSTNNLQGPLPEDLGRLQNLTFLQLSRNRLSGAMPYSLYTLTRLQVLAIANNSLSGALLPDIGLKLPNLQFLNLYMNQLDGTLPVSVANASRLQQIDLSYNRFAGRIPAIFGSLTYLNWLSLEHNNLEAGRARGDWAFISSLANCSQLQHLMLNNNDLGDELPISITNLSMQLVELAIGLNPRLGGVIPPGIANLVSLNSLELQQCNFTGPIPDSIGQLPQLQALVLFRNKLSGTIPSSLGKLTQLNQLFLDQNELQGEIPVSLGDCKNLNILDLSSNQLHGQIPSEVLSLASLSQYLNLSRNYLSGPLQPAVGRLQSLVTMDFSNNHLSGRIPESIGACQMLAQLLLGRNLFQGSIPTSIGSLRGLAMLDLSSNSLSGSFPGFLEELPYLQLLNLSFNDLDGEVPIKGVFNNATAVAVLGNARLCSGIAELHLPFCTNQKHRSRPRSLVVKVVVPVVCGIVLLCLSVSCFLAKRPRNTPLMTTPSNSRGTISYVELVKATDDFSNNNLIGVGTSGLVFKGVLNDDEMIAVKVLDLQQQGAFKAFMAECESLSKIRHRNLVKILTVCTSIDSSGNEFKALVFEFMQNGSLENWLHPKKDAKISTRNLSLAERLHIAIDVAEALNYLHDDYGVPIVHCDLKPSNVLLDDDLNARVGDFGLARFLQSGSTGQVCRGASSSLAVKGTIGYVPPEYGTGGPISTQGDVYSYGIMLLELITGRRPTDNMFNDGRNLPTFVEKELSAGTHVTLIADPLLFSDVECGINPKKESEKCLVLVLKVGLACSKERPGDRMKMKDVVTQLLAVREFLLPK